jgi:ribosomal protein S12 methylthiotransferase accessory factor
MDLDSDISIPNFSNDQILSRIFDFFQLGNKEFQSSFKQVFSFSDDPKLFNYEFIIKPLTENNIFDAFWEDVIGGGVSFFSKEEAAIKALMEGFERYALTSPKGNIYFKKIKDISKPNISPFEIPGFSSKQRRLNSDIRISKDDNIGWVSGINLNNDQQVLIPAQLVYLSYSGIEREPIIRIPISTGCAADTSLIGAITRGILEIIERDAFMIAYLNKMPLINIDIQDSLELSKVSNLVKKYNLEIKNFEISLDHSIYVFMSIIIDYTGIGPSISVGLHAGLDPVQSLISAISEGFHNRSYSRSIINPLTKEKPESKRIRSINERANYWFSTNEIHKLDFWLKNQKNQKSINNCQNFSKKNNQKDLSFIMKSLKEISIHNVYYVDITPNIFDSYPIKIVKVIIPEMHPLHLDENFKYLDSERLFKVPKNLGYLHQKNDKKNFNHIPHPFL